MALPEFLLPLKQWIEIHVLTSPELAVFGFVSAIALLVLLCVLLGRTIVRGGSRLFSALTAYAAARNPDPGYRVLLSTPEGRGGAEARRFLESAMAAHLSAFSFDAPFQLTRTGLIAGGDSDPSVAMARRRLQRADADMIVWGVRMSSRPGGFALYTLSRGGGRSADDALLESTALPGNRVDWDDTLAPIAAYIIARRLQPSLGRPSDFRAERMEPVVAALDQLLQAGVGNAPGLRAELEQDFVAAALHVGESGGKPEWIDRVIAIRTETIAELGATPAPGVWAQAKLDLGRAMLAKAERRYDADLVQAGATHLREAVEVMKTNDAMRAAEDAMVSLDKARNLIEKRKRFAINFNG